MLYTVVVEDGFGNPVSLLITNSPEERDGVYERERERDRYRQTERGDSRKRCDFKGTGRISI